MDDLEMVDYNEYEQFDKTDKYGSVTQRDLDKITGGEQTTKQFHLDINKLEKTIMKEDGLDIPSYNKLKDQLQHNSFFKHFFQKWDAKIERLLKNPKFSVRQLGMQD